MNDALRKFRKATKEFIEYTTSDVELFTMPTNEDLAEARKAAGLSLRDVSKQTGIPHATISRIEHGEKALHGHWVTLCQFYNRIQ